MNESPAQSSDFAAENERNMIGPRGSKLRNWKGTITYHASALEVAHSVDDIVRIVQDAERYPSPVRAKGSHHSTTKCIVAQHGTVIDMSKMNKILDIDTENNLITMQAGVLHIDAAQELEKHGLQFFVNVEIGNLTVGSGACGGTKDASYFDGENWEYGQVNSYVVGIKSVLPNGEILEVTENDGELMHAMRSSYGMLGIIFEVTFKVKPIKPMAVKHVKYHIDEFADRLDELIQAKRSMMLYMFPHIDTIVVEYRFDGNEPMRSNTWQWRIRNWTWKTGSPLYGKLITTLVPFRSVRSFLIDNYNRFTVWFLSRVLRGCNTSPTDQIIRYSEIGGFSAYTFSIWAFPKEEYAHTIKAYYRFCKEYYRKNGYRCDLLNVGYLIAEDRQSLFSYTRRGLALTLDPVSTGTPGWEAFLTEYNEFCVQHNGTPLFNQSRGITPLQAQQAFGEEIKRFQTHRKKYDPDGRFYTEYFRKRFEISERGSTFINSATE